MKKNKRKVIGIYAIFFILIIFLLVSIYINLYFKNVTFDQLIYSLRSSEGISIFSLVNGFKFVALYFSFIVIFYIKKKKNLMNNNFRYLININYKNSKYCIQCYPFNKHKKTIHYYNFFNNVICNRV